MRSSYTGADLQIGVAVAPSRWMAGDALIAGCSKFNHRPAPVLAHRLSCSATFLAAVRQKLHSLPVQILWTIIERLRQH